MYKVKDQFANDYVFIGGNTKYLRDCSQDEITLLIKNGKKNFFVKKTEEVGGGENPTETISEEIPALVGAEKAVASLPATKPAKK